MLEQHIDNEQEQKVMEFDIPLPLNEYDHRQIS